MSNISPNAVFCC